MTLTRAEWDGIVHAVQSYSLLTSMGETFCRKDFHTLPWRTFGTQPNAKRHDDSVAVTCLGCIAEGA